MLNLLLAGTFTFDGVNFYNNHISFTIFGKEITIMYYAISIICGILLAMVFSIPLFKKAKLSTDIVTDLLIAIVPLAVIGSRVWYVLNDLESYDSFMEMIDIRSGGLAIYGGVMGGALAVFLVAKIKKISFPLIGDIVVSVLPLGQAIGRWGNFFNQEVYGATTSMHFPFGVYIASEGEWKVGLFFIEGLCNFALFLAMFICFLKFNPKKNGYFIGTYFIGYGVIRFILEPFRDPKYNLIVLGVKSQVVTAVCSIIVGVAVIVYCLIRDKKLVFSKKGEKNEK